MKAPLLVVLAAVIAIASSALTVFLLRDSAPPTAAAPPADPGRSDLLSEIAALRREQAAIHATLGELRAATERLPPDRPARSVTEELAAAEAAAIAARALGVDRVDPAVTGADVARMMQRLLAPGLTEAERQAVWDELAAAGLLDAVVASYERRAQAFFNDPTAWNEAAFAYHQKMRHTESGLERGKWGRKGSEAYAQALELDATNWEARFAQAQHFLDAELPGDALQHLQLLRGQQMARRPEARHAQAFVLLGNLLLSQGNAAEAKQVWSEGLALFPDDARLRGLANTGN